MLQYNQVPQWENNPDCNAFNGKFRAEKQVLVAAHRKEQRGVSMRDVAVVILHYTSISAFKISPRKRKLIKATPNSH